MHEVESMPGNEVARILAQHGITRVLRDPVAAARYKLVQQGMEIFYEHADQQDPPAKVKSEWRDRRDEG